MERHSSMHTRVAYTRWSRLYLFMFLVVVVLGDDANTILAENIKYSYTQDLVDPASGLATPSCGANERYTTCASSTCFEDTCYDVLYTRPGPKYCTKDCSQGCQCQPGFYRSRDGRCVDANSCTRRYGFSAPITIEKIITHPQAEKENSDGDGDNIDPTKSDTSPLPLPCGQNERYTTCTSSTCFEDTCVDVLDPQPGPKKCTEDCRQGCQCQLGFYRSQDGQCVHADKCRGTYGINASTETENNYYASDYPSESDMSPVPPSCGENERYTTCASSTCFEDTCVDVLNPQPGPKKCTRDCRQGCQCQPGFYRSQDGQCVDFDTCISTYDTEVNDDNSAVVNSTNFDMSHVPPSCGENERYTTCASFTCFEESCADVLYPQSEPKNCTEDCRRGCQCKLGYYRNHDGRCIDAISCAMCGYGEQWVSIDSAGDRATIDSYYSYSEDDEQFELACEDVLFSSIDDCCSGIFGSGQQILRNGCYCAPEFYRSIDGLCVSKDTCEHCGKNEIWEHCGSSSCWEYTCDDVGKSINELLLRPCTLDCHQGCKCSQGFYREEEVLGECVSAEFCIMIREDSEVDDFMDDYIVYDEESEVENPGDR